MICEGYGVDMSKISLKVNAYELLFNMLKKANSYLYDMACEYAVVNESDYLEDDGQLVGDLPSVAFYDFTEWYENDTYLWGDFCGVLTDFINEQEFANKTVFHYEDFAIHVLADIPADEESKKQFPTREKIDDIFNEYLNPLLNVPANVEWLEIHS